MSIHEVFVYLRSRNAEESIAFYKNAFGATEKFRLVAPDGRIGHVELEFGDTIVMISDEFPECDAIAPAPDAPSHFAIHLHVDDADAVMATAVKHGAKITMPATDQFYGERSGKIRDPFGYDWLIGHSIESVTPKEMQNRYAKTGT